MDLARLGKGSWALASALFAVLMSLCVSAPSFAVADSGDNGDLTSAKLSAQAAKLDVGEDAYFYFDDMYYTGSAITPTHEAYTYDNDFNRVKLTEGKDFTVSYQNNTKPGKAKAVVTGIGNYTGTVTKEFTIDKRAMWDDEVTAAPIENIVYTGFAITPEPVLSIGSYTLKKGVDYQLEYYGNVDAGTGHITCTGIGNFEYSKDVTFTIVPASINDVNFTFADEEYTGWAVMPTPIATFHDVGVASWDYTITYTNNIAVGTAEAHITGNGNFTGERVVPFNIIPSTRSYSDLVVDAKSKTLTVKYAKLKKKAHVISGSKAYRISSYSGVLSYKKLSASAKGKAKSAAKKIKVNKKNGAITLPKKAPKGTYTVKVQVADNNGYLATTKTVKLKIKVK